MTESAPQAADAEPAFTLVHREFIESLNLTVEQYEHRQTGAMHYHLATDNTENVFLVALRTVPEDSTGVAHILEHTALCGSRNFPVRDPFFMMLRRSLNTFMNALTSSDWTAYPFASQNRKDFNNLLEVYLDAVFFSRLDPLDFAQEGHRVEFAEPDNPDSDLVFKGVVYNEMKGAMSSITSTLWQTLCEYLFPTSTYHYNSGGDPECIPDLTYEQMLAFYRSHYHPSNAIFMTFGDIPAREHQAVMDENALRHFERLPTQIRVQPEQRRTQPLRVEQPYAYDENDTTDNKTHIIIGWMLGESTDLQQLLEAELLASVLTDNSSSPLRQLLETTELGHAPSPLVGLEDSMREMVFCCGIEGSEPDNAEALESAGTGSYCAESPTRESSRNELEAVLHQLELHQREISGDSFPYGLQLILEALGCATHYADPITVLNLDPVIETLREKIRDPDYIRDLARRLLLDNPHRVTLVMSPDRDLTAQRRAREVDRLARIRDAMDDAARDATIKLAAELDARQQNVDESEYDLLPRVTLDDVPQGLPDISFSESANGVPLTTYAQGTNGIVYQQVVAPLPALEDAQLQILPVYSHFLTELGMGELSYLQAQELQASTVGSINAFTTMRGSTGDEQDVGAHFNLSSKALLRHAGAQSRLMFDVLHRVRFDETDRLRELLQQLLSRREQSITGNGHGMAMAAACAGMSPVARLNHLQSGLEGIRNLRALNDSLGDSAGAVQFSQQLAALHERLQAAPVQLLAIADEQHIAAVAEDLSAVWESRADAAQVEPFSLAPLRERRGELWLANTQVHFCARAYPTVPVDHPDAAVLTVLGGFLRNGYLHRAIREQGGAYGGGASQDSGIAAFRFYSYRDPRLAQTLADFDAAVIWMLENQHDSRALEEAILGVISSIDRPSSPAGEAKQHFHNRLYGRSHAQREAFRQQVLAVTLEDLRRVTRTYLNPEMASTAVIVPTTQREATAPLREELDLALREL
ncbi:MAG: insulinase family protein [Halioglobus sp.]|nr:insulinase family protein [Halioglobus sp.]